MKPTKNILFTAAAIAFALASSAWAAVTLPPVLGNNMVVQSGEPISLWGWADAGEKITIKQGGAVVATAVGAGKEKTDKPWQVKLPAQKPGAVADIEVAGANTITLTNVLAGDVWLCSGQSNMVMTLLKGYAPVLNGEAEAAAATKNHIRFYNGVGESAWVVCTPETAGRFSAVGYFFAQKLNAELKVPVGMMVVAGGGRPAEDFTPPRMMDGDADFQAQKIKAQAVRDEFGAKGSADGKAYKEWRAMADAAQKKGEPRPAMPVNQLTKEQSALLADANLILDFGWIYRDRIPPLASFPITGFIWYQGEANSKRGDKYEPLLTKLIQGWREDWGNKPLPFIIVALAGWGKPEPWTPGGQGSFPLVREAGIKISETLPNVGVISAVDVGEAGNIHPSNKKPVGERAALWALNHVHGRKVVSEGPKFGKVVFSAGKAVVPFLQNAEGLTLKGPGGFELAGEDRKFVPAKAELKGGTLEVTAPEVPKPVALRYAFLNFPECTVSNGAGLPALPFRTDDWPVMPGEPVKK